MASNNDLQHEEWQQIDTMLSDEESFRSSDEFILSFSEAYATLDPAAAEPPKVTSFRVSNRDLLTSSPKILSQLLSRTSIASSSPGIIETVMDRVRAAPITQLKLTVNITLVDASVPDDEEEDNHNDDDESEGLDGVWASVQSLEGFDRVGGNCGDQCSICLDDFLVRREATKMPCSHVYHRECIFQWLGKGNSCPLCRYHVTGC